MVEWTKEPLDWMLAKRFSRVIRDGDRVECEAHGSSAYRSLEWAINHGAESWAVMVGEGRVPAGVYGWTTEGAIWSYWRDLTRAESIELVRRTPAMVLEMVERSGLGSLANFVWEGNKPALDWLQLCGCFNLRLDERYTIGNKQFIPFRTKPVEDIRQCAPHS